MYTHIGGFNYKAKKTSLTTTIPKNLETMRTLRETYIDLIYMGSRKRQDLLSKLRAWGPWGRIERKRREATRGAEKYVRAQ